MGSYFGISGPPQDAIMLSGDHSGGPGERPDGPEAVNNKIFGDLGVILEFVYGSFWEPECLQIRFVLGLFASGCFYRFLS